MSSRQHRYGEGGRGPPSPRRHHHHHPPPLGRNDDEHLAHHHQHHNPAARGRGPPLPYPVLMEEQLHLQHQELQGLLIGNQRLAATHVALKQELHAARHDVDRASHAAKLMHADYDAHLREVYEKSAKMEMEVGAAEAQREELLQVRGDIEKLNAARQELLGQVQSLTQDVAMAASELQQVPAIKAEIDAMKQELACARSTIEHEKRAYAATFEQGQLMEKNLVSMAREVEKLRTELANAEKRSQATSAAGHPGAAYGGNYGYPDPGYGGNSYPASYGINLVQEAADGSGQYGSGHGSWNLYDMQRSHGRR